MLTEVILTFPPHLYLAYGQAPNGDIILCPAKHKDSAIAMFKEQNPGVKLLGVKVYSFSGELKSDNIV